jgi:hypothetical protein
MAARASAWQHTKTPNPSTAPKKSSTDSDNSDKENISEEEKSWIKEWSKEDEDNEKGCSRKRIAAIKSSKGTVCKQPRFMVGILMAKAAMEDLVQAAIYSGTWITVVLIEWCSASCDSKSGSRCSDEQSRVQSSLTVVWCSP